MKNIISLCIVFSSYLGVAQVEDAWVYFTDKLDVETSIANPITILTQEAIDRKNAHGVTIDERDVPVNEDYITQLKNTTGLAVLAKSKWFNCAYVRGEKAIIENVQGTLNFVSQIVFADPSLNAKAPFVVDKGSKIEPFDKYGSRTDFNYGSADAQIKQLNAHVLHEQDYTGQGMIMAIMDSGFPGVNTIGGFQRIRDEGRLLDGYDFVSRNDDEFAFAGSSHGTLTFSDIAGYIEDQFVGTAPDASYYLFRTEDVGSEGPHEEAFWVEAVERADSLGVDVVNTSLGYSVGFDNPNYEYTTADMDGQTAFISRGVNIAFEKGMLMVTSAGNSGGSSWGIITAPADAPGALTVGAVNAAGAYASFSSRGPTADSRVKPDVMARGSAAAVITSGNSVSSSNGTSFSGPIMAGAVTCLWQAFPMMTNAEIMQLVRESAHLYNTPTDQMGYGIPDFQSILENLSITDLETIGVTMFPNPVQDELFINSELGMYTILLFAQDGKLLKRKTLYNSGRISLQNLSSGLYLGQIVSNNKRFTFKISKQ